MVSIYRQHWDLDPEFVYLNHGSFGACPRVVLKTQQDLRNQMERQPVRFFLRTLMPLWDAARERVAALVSARPQDLAFVNNATVGVNTALRSFPLSPGDEVLVTNQNYNACINAARRWTQERGAKVVALDLPFPVSGPEPVIEAIEQAVTPRTRLAIIDHVTSPTGLVLPVQTLVQSLKERGVETLVDGAHALGMLPLDLPKIGAAYYTGNAHKWLCAPKGAAILHVRADMQDSLRPLATSHGMNRKIPGRAKLWDEMDWTGTQDPTPWLSIPASLDFLEGLMPGGLAGLRSHNHQLLIEGRALVCDRLGLAETGDDAMLGSLATLELPGGPPETPSPMDPLQETLYELGIEVPVIPWNGRRLLRISAQAYNSLEDYEALAQALSGQF